MTETEPAPILTPPVNWVAIKQTVISSLLVLAFGGMVQWTVGNITFTTPAGQAMMDSLRAISLTVNGIRHDVNMLKQGDAKHEGMAVMADLIHRDHERRLTILETRLEIVSRRRHREEDPAPSLFRSEAILPSPVRLPEKPAKRS
jgi:hypothetical protein